MLEADSTPLLMDRETFTTGRACHWRRRNSNNPRACLLNLSSFSTFVFILLFPKLVFVLGNPNVHFLFSATNYVCIYNGSLGNMLCYMCYLLSHKSWKLSIPRTEKKKTVWLKRLRVEEKGWAGYHSLWTFQHWLLLWSHFGINKPRNYTARILSLFSIHKLSKYIHVFPISRIQGKKAVMTIPSAG